MKAAGALTLPAASRHVPASGTAVASGPVYVVEVHWAMPDTGSVPVQLTVTGLANQPFALAAVCGTACTAAGGILSILTFASAVIVTPVSYVAWQRCVTPLVSSTIRIAASQPDVLTRPCVPTSQRTVTGLRYQPLAPAVPMIAGVTPGVVAACAGEAAPAKRSAPTTSRTAPLASSAVVTSLRASQGDANRPVPGVSTPRQRLLPLTRAAPAPRAASAAGPARAAVSGDGWLSPRPCG